MDEKVIMETQIPDTENTAEDTPHVSSDISETVNGVVEESTEVVSGGAISANIETMTSDVHVIMVIVVLTFVMSCMRAWRQFAVKGVN